jgi:predicted MPP superfamily phosphohydrolase
MDEKIEAGQVLPYGNAAAQVILEWSMEITWSATSLRSQIGLSPLRTTRRQFLRGAAAAGALAIAGDAIFMEPNRPLIVRREFLLPRWPERLNGFTIALLSDFHYDPYFSVHPLHAAIAMVNRLSPDLIVLAGDFVSVPAAGDKKKGAFAAEPCARLLRQMTARHGLWAVLGNHDDRTDPEHVTRALQTENIQVLANQSEPIERDGGRIWLSGVNDVMSGTADLAKTLGTVPSDEPVILLAHEPDFADEASRFPIDLQLSGHSHGGQVRLPLLPPLYLPQMAKKYVWGTYHVGPLTLYTNAGLGTVDVPMRWNCPPEITLLTLRSLAKRARRFGLATSTVRAIDLRSPRHWAEGRRRPACGRWESMRSIWGRKRSF